MRIKMLSTFLFLFFWSSFLKAQSTDSTTYFCPPMFLPFNLAGNFGEIRSNHFHSGVDIKTNEQEGQEVMAVADGYISRIKVSSFGFGKALYINHPNGYTTVYAHLQRFSENIQTYIDSVQHAHESFETDVMPDSNLFPIRQQQFIAFSGNTGGSEGPHLHFEIRNKVTERPINPLLFGFRLEDTIPPAIENIRIYQLHNSQFGLITDTSFTISYSDSSVVLPKHLPKGMSFVKGDTVFVFENTAFSVETFDLMNESESHLEAEKIELLMDGKIVYTYHLVEFGFDETKYVNANIDFAEKINDNRTYTLLYHLPGNNPGAIDIPKKDSMNGVIVIKDDSVHEAEIRVSDINGNMNTRKIYLVHRKNNLPLIKKINFTPGNFISYKKMPLIKQPDIGISFPTQPATYNVAPFSVKREMKLKGTYSTLFSVGDKTIPIHTFMLLSVKPVKLVPELFSKALIVSMDEHGNKSAEESRYADGWVTGKIRHFGKFTITVDTIAPEIKTPYIFTDSISCKRKLSVLISDDLSGIKTYRATLDGKWILMEYDYRIGTLTYEVRETNTGRKAELSVEVIDRKENKAVCKMEMAF